MLSAYYPLYKWEYSEICGRLDTLVDYELYNESVIASTQTIEQALKRVIQQAMTKQRKGFRFSNSGKSESLSLIDIKTKKERDKNIRRLASLGAIQRAWRLLIASENKKKRLNVFVNSICGAGAWNTLSSKNKVKVWIPSGPVYCRCGLFELRHRLVHGVHSPPLRDIEILATWGVGATKELLNPKNGLVQALGWNPQKRISPFYDI